MNLDIKKLKETFSKLLTFTIPLRSSTISMYYEIKEEVTLRLFWGRNNFYKQVIHLAVLFFTLLIFLTSFTLRLSSLANTSTEISRNDANIGNIDSLQQGSGVESFLVSKSDSYFSFVEYIVKDGDSLDSISQAHSVSKNTIKDSNRYLFGTYSRYTNENVNPGEKLLIPEINGVIYQVQEGDNLDAIFSKVNGDREKTIQLNSLDTVSLNQGMKILVPDGSLPAPSAPVVVTAYIPPYNGSAGTLVNPLLNCGGYTFTQGFSAWHDGVDLARYIGCPINSIGNGVVTSAGWGPYGEGYHVKIDHGGGVSSYYYHGNGTFYVRPGDYVSGGQNIMDMGCSGSCTGPHLHFIIKIGGYAVNPIYYVPI